jgi:preprotein translocase subunit YajC
MPFSGPDLTLLLIAGVFLALILFNGRKRKAAITNMKNNMKVGANVIMAGGVKGKVVEIREDSVIIETTPGIKIEYLKAAVNTVVAPSLDAPVAPVKSAPAKAKNSASKAKAATPAAKPVAKKTTTKKTAK